MPDDQPPKTLLKSIWAFVFAGTAFLASLIAIEFRIFDLLSNVTQRSYSAHIQVQNDANCRGQGWDYDLRPDHRHPDPYLCLAKAERDQTCVRPPLPDHGGCLNQLSCTLEITAPRSRQFAVSVFDNDDGNFIDRPGDNLIGEADCIVGEPCALHLDCDGTRHQTGSVILHPL